MNRLRDLVIGPMRRMGIGAALAVGVGLASLSAYAQLPPPMATLELDWEPVSGAGAYEVQLTPKDGEKTIVIPSNENRISQRVPIGSYSVRIRSKDGKSGYFGKWSESTDIEVSSKTIYPVSPADQAVVSDSDADSADVEFRWQPHEDAKEYTVHVWSDNVQETQEQTTTGTTTTLSLATGRVYHWNVTFETARSVLYQADPLTWTFSLLGRRLLRPEIDPKITSRPKTILKWSSSPESDHYEVKLLRRALDETDWQPLHGKKAWAATLLKTQRLNPGAYRLEVTAHAKLRLSSETAIHEFVVKPTERELRNAMARSQAWLGPSRPPKKAALKKD